MIFCVFQSELVDGIFPPLVQDLAFPLVELQEVLIGPFVWPVKVPLCGSMSLCCISPSSQIFIACRFAEGVLSPIIQVSNGEVQVWTPVSTSLQLSHLQSAALSVLHSAYLSCSSVRMLWGTVLKVLPASRFKTSTAFPLMLCSAVQEIVLSRAWLELLEKRNEFCQIVISKISTTKQIQDVDQLIFAWYI